MKESQEELRINLFLLCASRSDWPDMTSSKEGPLPVSVGFLVASDTMIGVCNDTYNSLKCNPGDFIL